MRQRFVQVLRSEEGDDVMDAVVRRFWTRAIPIPARVAHPVDAQVVDLARWARGRGVERS
jgi:hypothetical protein